MLDCTRLKNGKALYKPVRLVLSWQRERSLSFWTHIVNALSIGCHLCSRVSKRTGIKHWPLFFKIRKTRVYKQRKTLAVPIVDGLEWNSLLHTRYWGASASIGIFEWGLLYKEMTISQEKLKTKERATLPNRLVYIFIAIPLNYLNLILTNSSPTHAGGLLAIDKKWFEELGYYDDGIKIWGGEQYELSFKVGNTFRDRLFIDMFKKKHFY
jgi:hypothetical protein